jgi:serine/threonine protein kinase
MSILTSNLKLLGSGGTACAVMVTLKDKDEKPMKYVLKITTTNSSLIYEYIMGLHINALMAREDLDCFIHTHALYYGTMQIQVDMKSDTINVLDNSEPTNMIRLYEANISGNFSIEDLCNSIAVQGNRDAKLQQIIQLDFAPGYTIQTILDHYTSSLEQTSLAGNSILEILFQAYTAIIRLQGHFVHGDLNIGNIVISDNPKPPFKHSIKIIDYGTCKIPESVTICETIKSMDEKHEPCYNLYTDVCVTYDILVDNNWIDLLYVVALKELLADKKYSALEKFLGIPEIDYTVWGIIKDSKMKENKKDTYTVTKTISTVKDMYDWINQKYTSSLS